MHSLEVNALQTANMSTNSWASNKRCGGVKCSGMKHMIWYKISWQDLCRERLLSQNSTWTISPLWCGSISLQRLISRDVIKRYDDVMPLWLAILIFDPEKWRFLKKTSYFVHCDVRYEQSRFVLYATCRKQLLPTSVTHVRLSSASDVVADQRHMSGGGSGFEKRLFGSFRKKQSPFSLQCWGDRVAHGHFRFYNWFIRYVCFRSIVITNIDHPKYLVISCFSYGLRFLCVL